MLVIFTLKIVWRLCIEICMGMRTNSIYSDEYPRLPIVHAIILNCGTRMRMFLLRLLNVCIIVIELRDYYREIVCRV